MNKHPCLIKARLYRSGSFLILFLQILLFLSCNNDYNLTGVNSPDPGIIRIFIQSENTDDHIIIAGDTVSVGKDSDFLDLSVGQGRAYREINYATLYKSIDEESIDSYRELTKMVNIIKLDENTYQEFLIFESFLPPASFDSLRIGMTASFLQIGYYQIPIEMPEGVSSIVTFHHKFNIHEDGVTEIYLSIKPFQSLVRVGDSYHFLINIDVAEIKYL